MRFASILPAQQLRLIKLDLISPAPEGQARQQFDEERLRTLADSLCRSGVREPIIVTPHGAELGRFQIVAGERRWRAARLADLEEIPCIVDPNLVDRRAKLLAQAEENLHRENLNAVEEAQVLAQLMEAREIDVREAGELIGRSYAQARASTASTRRSSPSSRRSSAVTSMRAARSRWTASSTRWRDRRQRGSAEEDGEARRPDRSGTVADPPYRAAREKARRWRGGGGRRRCRRGDRGSQAGHDEGRGEERGRRARPHGRRRRQGSRSRTWRLQTQSPCRARPVPCSSARMAASSSRRPASSAEA